MKMFKFADKIKVVLFVALAWLPVGTSLAATTNTGSPGIDLTIQNLLGILNGLVCIVSEAAVVIIVLALIFYGLQFLFSKGDAKKYEDAKTAFKYGLIGIIIVIGTYTIIATIQAAIGGDDYENMSSLCP